MSIEAIGEAWRHGWRITARCAFGNRDGMKSIRPCSLSYDLDLRTLIWTRGVPFPLSEFGAGLNCPRCGSRRVALIFHAPGEPQTGRAANSCQTGTRSAGASAFAEAPLTIQFSYFWLGRAQETL